MHHQCLANWTTVSSSSGCLLRNRAGGQAGSRGSWHQSCRAAACAAGSQNLASLVVARVVLCHTQADAPGGRGHGGAADGAPAGAGAGGGGAAGLRRGGGHRHRAAERRQPVGGRLRPPPRPGGRQAAVSCPRSCPGFKQPSNSTLPVGRWHRLVKRTSCCTAAHDSGMKELALAIHARHKDMQHGFTGSRRSRATW